MAQNSIPPLVFELIQGVAKRNGDMAEEVLATLTHEQVAHVAMNAIAMLGGLYRTEPRVRSIIDTVRDESAGKDWPTVT